MKYARFVTGKPQIKFLALLVGTFFLMIAAFTVSAQQTSEAKFRVKNENSFNINLIQFKRIEYVGECTGTVFSPDSQSARFVSSKTPPGPNRRVMIKNVTDGMETDPYPYTDRDYDKGEFSEDFRFKLGNSHKTKTFSVLEGENKFTYEIKENSQVIEQSTLTAEVSIQNLGIFPRQRICNNKLECRDTSDCSDSKGRNRICRRECFPVQECRCP